MMSRRGFIVYSLKSFPEPSLYMVFILHAMTGECVTITMAKPCSCCRPGKQIGSAFGHLRQSSEPVGSSRKAKQPWLVDQRPDHGSPLAFPHGKRGWEFFQKVLQPDTFQEYHTRHVSPCFFSGRPAPFSANVAEAHFREW